MAPRFAVFGRPIAHSLSPRIHAAFGLQCGIGLHYTAIEAGPEDFPSALERFGTEGGRGANVTLPLKEQAVGLVCCLDPAAVRAGAVNVLTLGEDGWVGANTDGVGFIADLQRLGLNPEGARVVVLGAGGAARGIIGPLLDAGVRTLSVVNRTPERARALADRFGDTRLQAIPLVDVGQLSAPQLLINAMSAGHSTDAPLWPACLCGGHTVAYDLSYGAAAAGFIGWARAGGAVAGHDGLGMLVEQAAEAFRLWHGVRPDGAVVLRRLRQQLGGEA